jgi:hypothetical protein
VLCGEEAAGDERCGGGAGGGGGKGGTLLKKRWRAVKWGVSGPRGRREDEEGTGGREGGRSEQGRGKRTGGDEEREVRSDESCVFVWEGEAERRRGGSEFTVSVSVSGVKIAINARRSGAERRWSRAVKGRWLQVRRAKTGLSGQGGRWNLVCSPSMKA